MVKNYWMVGDKNVAKRPEVRLKLSQNNPMNRSECRKKVSIALKRRYSTMDHHMKGVPKSSDHRRKIQVALKKRYKNRVHHCKGITFTDEHRMKISKALLDLYESTVHHKKGVPHSLSHQMKLSVAKKNNWLDLDYRNKMSGESSSLWKGGKSFNPYPPEFNEFLREYVRVLFNRNCVICFKKEWKSQRLDIHHVDGNKNNNSVRNLVPVHHNICHSLIEKVGR